MWFDRLQGCRIAGSDLLDFRVQRSSIGRVAKSGIIADLLPTVVWGKKKGRKTWLKCLLGRGVDCLLIILSVECKIFRKIVKESYETLLRLC